MICRTTRRRPCTIRTTVELLVCAIIYQPCVMDTRPQHFVTAMTLIRKSRRHFSSNSERKSPYLEAVRSVNNQTFTINDGKTERNCSLTDVTVMLPIVSVSLTLYVATLTKDSRHRGKQSPIEPTTTTTSKRRKPLRIYIHTA